MAGHRNAREGRALELVPVAPDRQPPIIEKLRRDLMGILRPVHNYNVERSADWWEQKNVQAYVFETTSGASSSEPPRGVPHWGWRGVAVESGSESGAHRMEPTAYEHRGDERDLLRRSLLALDEDRLRSLLENIPLPALRVFTKDIGIPVDPQFRRREIPKLVLPRRRCATSAGGGPERP